MSWHTMTREDLEQEAEKLRLLVDDEDHLSWVVAQRLCQRHNKQYNHDEMYIYRIHGAYIYAGCGPCMLRIIINNGHAVVI
jgi:hypothetical protein